MKTPYIYIAAFIAFLTVVVIMSRDFSPDEHKPPKPSSEMSEIKRQRIADHEEMIRDIDATLKQKPSKQIQLMLTRQKEILQEMIRSEKDAK